MGILIDKKNNRAHLYTKNSSYVLEVFEGELLHSYWGKRIELPDIGPLVPLDSFCSFYPNPNLSNKSYSLDVIPREYPDFGRSDYRNPAVRLKLIDGSRITKFVFKSFYKMDGKPKIQGLPSTYAEHSDQVETLVVELFDEKSGVTAKLYYSVFKVYDVITRHTELVNNGRVSVTIEHALSANVDFFNDHDFDLVHFPGSWARERDFSRIDIGRSTHTIESKRGSSSHMQNPLVLLCRKQTDEFQGEVYGMNFVYSGSFKTVVEVDSYNTTRFQMGLNDFDFEWHLEPSATFSTPEVVMTYSHEGFNGLSNNYHRIYRERLCNGKYRDKARPILINNWEATYFSFTEKKLQEIIDSASNLGMELFVLDDGWFGKRDSDQSGLGDWFVNTNKLTKGLTGISDYAVHKNMHFGLWFEPEMVSPDSDLYRSHPDWCLHVDRHSRSEGRNQLVLDMSRTDVQDYLIEVIGEILRKYPISYVKWDMNRNMTEVGSSAHDISLQKEISHRYILGLYKVLEVLTTEFSEVLFESCSGGGGRFDPGMLYYMPQTWTSDNTDAHERMSIQYGTSFAYPMIAQSAHVSMSPNHQVGRSTALETRAFASMMANLGYELDLSALSLEEKDQVLRQVAFYKSIRRDIQFGRFYRLSRKGNQHAFLIESENHEKYYLFVFRSLNHANRVKETLPLHYLEEGQYRVEKISFLDKAIMMRDANGALLNSAVEADITEIYRASYLNNKGYTLELQKHDFDGQLIIFSKVHDSGLTGQLELTW